MKVLLEQPVREARPPRVLSRPAERFAAQVHILFSTGRIPFMTTATIVPRTTYPHTTVSGELLDALVEAVVLPPDPRARSAVIWRLVREMCDTVEWLHERDTGLGRATDEELASIRRLASAAYDHRLRLAAFGSADTGAER